MDVFAVSEVNVVPAAHHHVQTRRARNPQQCLRIAADANGCDVDDRGAAGFVELTGLFCRDIGVEHLEVVDTAGPEVTDPP